jgi:hypothetical protein
LPDICLTMIEILFVSVLYCQSILSSATWLMAFSPSDLYRLNSF